MRGRTFPIDVSSGQRCERQINHKSNFVTFFQKGIRSEMAVVGILFFEEIYSFILNYLLHVLFF
jgi:hypothetical protein